MIAGCEACSLTIREERKIRVFENRVLRSTFRPKRDKIVGYWRKLHNEELYNLCPSPNIIRMIKSTGLRWSDHVARLGRRLTHKGVWWKRQKERDPWEYLYVGERIILKWILEK
jgi:hypothetical protein